MCSWVSCPRLLTPNTAWRRRLGQETGPGRQAFPGGREEPSHFQAHRLPAGMGLRAPRQWSPGPMGPLSSPLHPSLVPYIPEFWFWCQMPLQVSSLWSGDEAEDVALSSLIRSFPERERTEHIVLCLGTAKSVPREVAF